MTSYYKEVLDKNPAYGKAYDSAKSALSEDLSPLQAHYLMTWAPVICEFAMHVLNDAVKRGIDRLYFLSRDAYPVYRAAQILAGDNPSYPELKYIRVSRYSLRIPEMAISRDTFLDFLFLSGIDVTMNKIFRRGALTDEEISEVLFEIGYRDTADKILSRPEILYWKEQAKKCSEVIWPFIYSHAKPQLSNVLSYLRQEGFMDQGKIAVVDSGWVGTTQRSIKRLINVECPGKDIEGYYFGLYSLPADVDKNTYHAFYFRPKKDVEKKVYFSNCLFEAVFSEPTRMTLGYEMREGKAIPVQSEGDGLNGQFLRDMDSVILAYADALKEHLGEDNKAAIGKDILYRLMAHPTPEEADSYGRLKFCDDVLEAGAQDIAATLSYDDIRNLRLLRKLFLWIGKKLRIRSRLIENTAIHESGWIYASIVRCGKNVGWSLFQARLYQWVMYARKSL